MSNTNNNEPKRESAATTHAPLPTTTQRINTAAAGVSTAASHLPTNMGLLAKIAAEGVKAATRKTHKGPYTPRPAPSFGVTGHNSQQTHYNVPTSPFAPFAPFSPMSESDQRAQIIRRYTGGSISEHKRQTAVELLKRDQ